MSNPREWLILRNQIVTLASYVTKEALHTSFFVVMVILLLIGVGLTLFVGQITLTEGTAIKSSLLAAFLRLSAAYGLSLFVITSIVREFNDHTLYLWLSFPLPRSRYFIGKFSGFAVVSAMTAGLYGIALLVYASYDQASLWALSLFCELLIITALSLLCVFTFPYTLQAFSTVLGFYILARSINAMQLMTQSPLQSSDTGINHLVNNLVELLALLLPNLEHFTQSEWLVYQTGSFENLLIIGVQTFIYVSLLIGMSLFDLYRKNL